MQRLEKFLEDAGIKLSSVASNIMGVSGRAMLEALIAGVDDPGGPPDPAALADLAKRRLRSKIPALVEALTGRFTEHHAFLVRLHLDQIDRLTAALGALATRIEAQIAPFRPAVDLLTTIPGVERYVAEVIIAETGGDMTAFPSAGHLASRAGVVPGHRESAGKNKSGKTRPGNSYLKGAMGVAAFSAAGTNGSRLQARYRRLTARRGPLRALVAVEHSILVSVWHMLTAEVPYTDLGGDYYTRQNPERAERRAVHALEALGYTVTLDRPDLEPAV